MRAADFFPFRHEARAGLLQAVRSLPPEHLEWKPAGGIRTCADWLRHLGQMEDWWIQSVVQGRPDFRPLPRHALGERREMLAYLDFTRGQTEALLQEWPAAMLGETRRVPGPFRGGPTGPDVTLHWIMHNIFTHEVHHRGQIYLYLRLMGIEPPSQ
ncbi:MAG: DinB family protein [Mycobacterium leprae]